MKTNAGVTRPVGRVLEWLVNLALLLIVLVVAGYYVSEWRQSAKRPGGSPGTVAQYKPGERLEQSLVGNGRMGSALILGISTNCRYCGASMPFYRRVAMERPPDVRFIVVGTEASDSLASYLERNQLAVDEVRGGVQLPRMNRTPTLMLVSGGGVVKQVWVGQLGASKESDVLSAIRARFTKTDTK